jgi:uncharacterized protein
MPDGLDLVQRVDLRSGEISKVRRTPQGGLIAPASFTRTGVFTYKMPDGSTRRELRHPDDVFAPASLETYKHAPVTVDHPGRVTPENWRSHSRGHVADTPSVADGHVKGELVLQDGDAIHDAEDGRLKEISCGYECQIENQPGTYNGEPFDVRQRQIRINHIAVGPSGWGRMGPTARMHLDAGAAVCEIEEDRARPYRGGPAEWQKAKAAAWNATTKSIDAATAQNHKEAGELHLGAAKKADEAGAVSAARESRHQASIHCASAGAAWDHGKYPPGPDGKFDSLAEDRAPTAAEFARGGDFTIEGGGHAQGTPSTPSNNGGRGYSAGLLSKLAAESSKSADRSATPDGHAAAANANIAAMKAHHAIGNDDDKSSHRTHALAHVAKVDDLAPKSAHDPKPLEAMRAGWDRDLNFAEAHRPALAKDADEETMTARKGDYNDDQPRDEHGRFGSGGSGGSDRKAAISAAANAYSAKASNAHEHLVAAAMHQEAQRNGEFSQSVHHAESARTHLNNAGESAPSAWAKAEAKKEFSNHGSGGSGGSHESLPIMSGNEKTATHFVARGQNAEGKVIHGAGETKEAARAQVVERGHVGGEPTMMRTEPEHAFAIRDPKGYAEHVANRGGDPYDSKDSRADRGPYSGDMTDEERKAFEAAQKKSTEAQAALTNAEAALTQARSDAAAAKTTAEQATAQAKADAAEVVKLRAEKDVLAAQNELLKTQLGRQTADAEDARAKANDLKSLEAQVDKTIAVRDSAKRIIGKSFKADGKNLDTIRLEVVKNREPECKDLPGIESGLSSTDSAVRGLAQTKLDSLYQLVVDQFERSDSARAEIRTIGASPIVGDGDEGGEGGDDEEGMDAAKARKDMEKRKKDGWTKTPKRIDRMKATDRKSA